MVGDSEGSGRVYHAWIHDPGSMTLLLGPPGSGKSTLLEILAGRANGNKNSILEGVVMYNNKQASDIRLSRFIAYISNQLNMIKQSSAIMSLTQLSQEVFDLFDRIILLSDGHVLFQGPRQDAIPYFATLGYIKPSYVESSEFLEDIAAGDSSQDDAKHTYWVESEPGIGLSLKTPSKDHCTVDAQPRRETELVVAKLSTKVGHSGGIESTGRVQVGDVITAISINNEEMQYLSLGPQKIQHRRTSHAYSILKQARGHIRLQVERYKEVEEENQAQWKQFQRPFVQIWWQSTKILTYRQIKITKRLHAIIKLRLFQYAIQQQPPPSPWWHELLALLPPRSTAIVLTWWSIQPTANELGKGPWVCIHHEHYAPKSCTASSLHSPKANLLQASGPEILQNFIIYRSSFNSQSPTDPHRTGLSMAGNGAPFFEYLILLFLVAYFGSSVSFFISAISSISEVGNALAGLLVSVFLLFSSFVIYPSNIPAFWKWLVYSNPIHWANVSFCKIQFNKGYTDPCSKYLGELPFLDQFPSMTVGNAYLVFYELSQDAKIPWLPYVILLGWIGIANLLTVLGLKKIEFMGTSQYDEGTKESTAIFNNITGYARPQTMLALLGGNQTSNGTLLKCLAGRVPVSGSLSGNLQANGFRIGTTFSRLIGYVEKLDAHQPYLSVRESLVFSAALRLGQEISPTSRRIHVELVLNQLGLLPYSNELVGCLRNTTGKTFEIAKKITIEVELAANPSILLLEEPISGFDTKGTLAILNILSQVSDSGRIIISNLTHPNARTLSFFDLALILTQEVHQAYFGPVGSNCNNVLGYFTSIPKAPHYSRRDSPVRFIMGALGIGTKMRGTPSLNFAQIYQASSLCEINNKEISSIKKTINNRKRNYLSSTYPAPYSRQAILIDYKDIYGATSQTLYIYMQVILIGVISANNVIPQIGTDRLVYFREKRAGMYLPIFYPISWAVGEIPYFFIATLAVVGIGTQSPSSSCAGQCSSCLHYA
ncbi:Brefeldin A resistance protein [Fagus crenata]